MTDSLRPRWALITDRIVKDTSYRINGRQWKRIAKIIQPLTEEDAEMTHAERRRKFEGSVEIDAEALQSILSKELGFEVRAVVAQVDAKPGGFLPAVKRLLACPADPYEEH